MTFSYERHRFKSHRIKVILHGPGIPGPPVERSLGTNKTTAQNVTIAGNKTENELGNHSGNLVNISTIEKSSKFAQANASSRSTITSKFTNYNGHNLHDDLAFEWHPGTSEVNYGDHGDYHDHLHEDVDSYVVEHGADNHGDRGWHAGHGEHGYGYGTNHHDGYDMNYGHGHDYGHGDHYGGGHHYGGGDHYGGEDHHEGEHHNDGHHQ